MKASKELYNAYLNKAKQFEKDIDLYIKDEMVNDMYNKLLNELKSMNFQSEKELYNFLIKPQNHDYKQVVNANIKETMMDHYLTVKIFNDPLDKEFIENFNINDYDIDNDNMLTLFFENNYC